MRSGFKSYALEPLLTGLCINMMQQCASYLCRGIEAVITGLTRNQFVPKAHEGSNPSLCARRFNLTHSGWIEPFLLAHRKWILTMRRTSQGSHLSVAFGELAHQWRSDKSSPLVNTPPTRSRSVTNTARGASEGTAMCRSDTTHYAGCGIRIAVCCILHLEIDKLACQS